MVAGHYIWQATGSIPLSPMVGKFRVKAVALAAAPMPFSTLFMARLAALGSDAGIFDNGAAAPDAAGWCAAGRPDGSRMEP
jgi:hypothetical protein